MKREVSATSRSRMLNQKNRREDLCEKYLKRHQCLLGFLYFDKCPDILSDEARFYDSALFTPPSSDEMSG